MPQTTFKGLEVQATGANAGTWGTVLNTQALEYVDLNLGGIVTVALTNVNVTLTASQSRNALIRLTGALTGNVVITTACQGFFIVTNATTGAFTVTFTNGVGTSATAVQGYSTLIASDLTNGCRIGNDIPGAVFVASGASANEGLVPDPGATAGTTRYLREDATWQIPPFQWMPSGRLTLTTGTPVTTSDVTGASAVYYIAIAGNTVPVWNGTTMAPITITGGQLTLTLNNPNHAANTNYDVFMFLDTATPTIGTGPPWTSATARGTGAGTTQITLVNGLWVNAVTMTARNGATTYAVQPGYAAYLGTIRTGSTAGTTDDSKSKRFLFNAYNQARRFLQVNDNTDTWSYSSTTVWRQANASTANQFGILIGLDGNAARFDIAVSLVNDTSNNRCAVGVGIDSTTTNSALLFGNTAPSSGAPATAHYLGYPGIGYHNVAWLEIGNVTFRGDDGQTFMTSGMIGEVWA